MNHRLISHWPKSSLSLMARLTTSCVTQITTISKTCSKLALQENLQQMCMKHSVLSWTRKDPFYNSLCDKEISAHKLALQLTMQSICFTALPNRELTVLKAMDVCVMVGERHLNLLVSANFISSSYSFLSNCSMHFLCKGKQSCKHFFAAKCFPPS